MNREQALVALFGKSQGVRLVAARTLERLATESDLSAIRSAYASETAPWIKSALLRAKAKLEGSSLPTRGLSEESADIPNSDEPDKIREETIGQVLHELSPAVGRVKMAAMAACTDYAGSRLQRELEQLTRLIDLFSRWRRVSSSQRLTQVDLRQLIEDVIADESKDGVVVLVVENPRQSPIVTDLEFLRAAVANGLRNAIEAIQAKGAARRGDEQVTISFGATDREYWLAIHDEGIGVSGGEHVFAATTTTKPGHRGLGLAIAQQAIRKLGGRVSLTPNSGGGAKFLVEVPLQGPVT